MIGKAVAHYRVGEKLGEGGMGAAYRAHDTKLGRDVAIKVLPPALANDADYLARFQREAQVLASLNHPNIAAIYGLEDNAIVMELVEGDELKGPLPLDEAVRVAKQIADALEAAHERGIIHRDLKPANIKITADGTVKVLDFGLAKAWQPVAASASVANSPTLTIHATQAGMIVGTAAYMSPEQAAGKPVDRRADIWAFGVVLWELITGRRLFEGETISHTLAAVLKDSIDLTPIPEGPVRTLIARCLDRNPKTRLGWIGEARIILATPAIVTPTTSDRKTWVPWTITALTIAVAFGSVWVRSKSGEAGARPLIRLMAELSADSGERPTFAVSGDGSRLAWAAISPAGRCVAIRKTSESVSTYVKGSFGMGSFSMSPDGRWLLGRKDNDMVRLSTDGGTPETVFEGSIHRGASWLRNGDVMAPLGSPIGLLRIPAGAGKPVRITPPDAKMQYRWPWVLPDESAVLVTVSADKGGTDIGVVRLDTGETRILVKNADLPKYHGSATKGHVLFVRDGDLYGLLLDTANLNALGEPQRLVEKVDTDAGFGSGTYNLTADGTLVYQHGVGQGNVWPIQWIQGDGSTTPLSSENRTWVNPRFSPDGKFLAVESLRPANSEVWIHDLTRRQAALLTNAGVGLTTPVWAPDSLHLVAARGDGRSGGKVLLWIRADGAGAAQTLLESDKPVMPRSISRDGRFLTYTTQGDIWAVPLDLTDSEKPKAGTPAAIVQTPSREVNHDTSPDGRWLAYDSDETGVNEVYVRPFPAGSGRWLVSTGGGSAPFWSANGQELFYRSPDVRLKVVRYSVQDNGFRFDAPQSWSERRMLTYFDFPNVAAHPDGKRLALTRSWRDMEKEEPVRLIYLVHFMDEVRRRLPF